MRNACKNVMYTVVGSWAYDGKGASVGMETWKKAVIGLDAVLIIGLAAVEAMVIKGSKKRKES